MIVQSKNVIIMKKPFMKLCAAMLIAVIVFSCNDYEKMNGVVNLSLTDAPIDAENVKSVVINVIGIQYQKEGNQWQSFEGFEGPQSIDLLKLTEGKSILLGEFSVGPGKYNGLRFMLDAPSYGTSASNPGCYIEYQDNSKEALFMPSGGQTGYKSIGSFTVPSNGTVEVTADFDVRKSVVEAGTSGTFILKPTVRIVVNNQAGTINGKVNGIAEGENLTVFAYENNAYSEAEAAEPEEEQPRFPNAVSSANVDGDGTFVLPFLAPGIYDLIVVNSDASGNFLEVKVVVEDQEVISETSTEASIELIN